MSRGYKILDRIAGPGNLRNRLLDVWLNRPAATGTAHTIALHWLGIYECLGVIETLAGLEGEGLVGRHTSSGYTFYYAKDISGIKRAAAEVA
jgi:hypothetical protein